MSLIATWRDGRQKSPRAPRNSVGAALASLAGDSAVYLTGGLLVGLGSVALVPLYTRSLPLREFGVYALLDVTVLILVTLATLKMDVSYLKWYADSEPSQRSALFGSSLAVGLLTSTLAGAALALLARGHAGSTWLQSDTGAYAWMLLPIVILESLQVMLLTDLRARRHAIAYSMGPVCRLFTLLGASYYLMGVRHEGLTGLFLGRLAGDIVCFAFLGTLCAGSIAWRFSWPQVRPMLRFGAPLLWCVFMVMLQDACGRYFLSRYGNLDDVGRLGVAIKIGAVFQLLVASPFGIAWGGLLFQVAKERDALLIYSKIFDYVFLLSMGVALVLTTFAPTLFWIFSNPAYYGAIAVLPLVLLARAASVIEQPASAGAYLAGQTVWIALCYTTALAANLLFLRWLVPTHGLMGVGWAWLLGTAVTPLLLLARSQRTYPMTFDSKLIVAPLLVWAGFIFAMKRGLGPFLFAHFTAQAALGCGLSLAVCALVAFDFRSLQKQRSFSDNQMRTQTAVSALVLQTRTQASPEDRQAEV